MIENPQSTAGRKERRLNGRPILFDNEDFFADETKFQVRKLRNRKKAESAEGRGKVKLEIYGEEMVERIVKLSGNSGRIYLPALWVGSRVKIVKLD
jgi:putative transposon-encoded protein